MPLRRFAGLTALHVLLLVALLEVAVNRVAVPMLRPVDAAPPSWHTYLDYAGLFLFYFAGTLAAFLLAQRCWHAIGARIHRRATVATGLVALTTLLAAAPLIVDAPAALSLTLEVAFAASVVALVVASVGRRRDVGTPGSEPLRHQDGNPSQDGWARLHKAAGDAGRKPERPDPVHR